MVHVQCQRFFYAVSSSAIRGSCLCSAVLSMLGWATMTHHHAGRWLSTFVVFRPFASSSSMLLLYTRTSGTSTFFAGFKPTLQVPERSIDNNALNVSAVAHDHPQYPQSPTGRLRFSRERRGPMNSFPIWIRRWLRPRKPTPR